LSTQQQPRASEPDSSVDDAVRIYRLVPTWNCQPVNGEWEFQSGAFDNATPMNAEESADDMSVVLGDTLAALARLSTALPNEAPACVENPDEWGVAVLEARFLKQDESQEIRRTPLDGEPAHGDVRGKKNLKRRRRLKKHANWVVQPARPPM
jgi:hypothetical protein